MRAAFDGRELHVDAEAATLIRGTWQRLGGFEIACQALLGFERAAALMEAVKQWPTDGWEKEMARATPGITWVRGVRIVVDL